MIKRTLFILFLTAFALSACGGNATPDPALDPMLAMTHAFATVNAALTQTAFAIPTNTPAPTETPTPTAPPTPVPFTPTTILPVTVTVPANCRFGPSTVYAGPGGLRTGKTLEAIGRDTSGQWFLVRDPGGKKACWVNIIALSIQGDPATLAIAPVELVFTVNYPAPSNVTATRNGDQVQISWGEVTVQPKDLYLDSRYFLEVWVCNGGQLTYTILATQELSITVTDQPGCAGASHGLVYTTTREGYSQPATIPWP